MDKAEGSTSLDLAKAAKLLTDMAVVESEADLSGIDVLEADEGFLRDAGQQVRAQAQVGATAGCHGLQVGTCAQPDAWVASVYSSQQNCLELQGVSMILQGNAGACLMRFAQTASSLWDASLL